jgi:hypothetical protein
VVIMSAAPISERIAGRSVQIVSSTIPPNVTLDELRRARAAARPFRAPRWRLLIEALYGSSPLNRLTA